MKALRFRFNAKSLKISNGYYTLSNKFHSNSSSLDNLEIIKSKFSNEITFRNSTEPFSLFRATDEKGLIINSKYDTLPMETAIKIFDSMIRNSVYDARYLMAHRESKISFYMTSKGEEAHSVVSSAALNFDDVIYPQYREVGALIYRGFSAQNIADQLTGNCDDNGKGRQMPVHYGSNKLNFQTVSSPLCTQVPQASGCGYHFRVKGLDRICLTYFGEGAASEGDFHSALNFASTLRSQTLFYCRNNMYAISTPIEDQYKGDGIAIRGLGYGIKTIRIDGNDVLAIWNAVKMARKTIIEEKRPVLIESMSYRLGDHSTSDLSKLYRNEEVMKQWDEYLKQLGNPIKRFENFLLNKGWIEKDHLSKIEEIALLEARNSLKEALSKKKGSIDSMFEDTWDNIPNILKEQRKSMHDHLTRYGEKYSLDKYQSV